MVALASAGFLVSLYLAAYQLGVAPGPWDPIFGPASSARVLHSALSRALPVPDAALGAAAYAVEAGLELAGGTDRWRTHPWRVLAVAAVAAALGLAGIGLVVVQVAVVRAGCTLCLCSAALSVAAALVVVAGGEPRAAARALGLTARPAQRRA